MNDMIKNARTLQEKREAYTKEKYIDYDVLKQWRNVNTLLTDKYFNEMLSVCGMTQDEFTYALQSMDEEKTSGDDWFQYFTKIIDEYEFGNIDYEKVGVNVVCLPFIKFLRNRLEKIVANLKNIKIQEDAIDEFVGAQAVEMFEIFGKLVAWKLNLYKGSNELKGETGEERFIEFLKNSFNSKETFLKFYEEYPVAVRVATVRTQYAIKNYTELIVRVDNDHEEIEKFIGAENLELTDIKLSTGDSHEQGNSVSILCFGDKKVVYKPKNLKICESFEKFVDWYVNASDLLDIRIPKGIYKEEYSYNEFIEALYCENEEEVNRFYTRYGYLIAICYLLSINDLHLENVIACGEYPVIIDLETLFQCAAEMQEDNVHTDLLKYLELNSVANSLLLPKQLYIGKDAINLSALDGRETKTSMTVLAPQKINTDEFHYEDTQSVFKGGNNIPKFNQTEEVNILKYNEIVYEGFNDFIKFVMENKSEFIQALDCFRDKRIRSLTKSTEKYASMIRYLNHPSYNSEMKYRERVLMNVWAYPYKDKRIVQSEVRDMLYNDIPIFFTRVDSKDLVDSQGIVYKDFHKITGYEAVVERINKLDEKEVKRQQSILLLSLGILDPYLNQKVTKREIVNDVRKIDCLKQAINISNLMLHDTYMKGEQCSFINIDCNEHLKWKIIPADVSIYGGLCGISIFYLELYMRTKDEQYYDMYQRLIKTVMLQIKRTYFDSAFTGWFSPVYPLILEYKYLGKVTDSEYLEFTATKLKSIKDEDIERIKNSDYISGLAGIVRVLTLLNQTFDDKYVTKDIIERFGKLLITRLENDDNEMSIKQAGIAHGICGVMYGLLSAKLVSPEYVKKMLEKEYLIGVLEKDTYKWCWGLPGLIQARLAILKINSDCIDKDQLNEIISKFEDELSNMVDNDTLCHGNGSIITTLNMIYEYTHDEKWITLMEKWISNVKLCSLYNGYKIQKVADIVSKGMFDGIYGVAWMYLYSSSSINNVLLLETK